jgi:hypothetical protein
MSRELLSHATLRSLLLYWQEKRGARRMPARHDIDPIEMDKQLLPHLMLCELAEHGNIIRFRLVGTSLAKRLGFDPTGQRLSDLPKSDYFDFLGKLLRRTYTEAAPLYGESAFSWSAKGRLEARHLLLPLSAGGAEPTIVLVGTTFSSDEVFPPQIRTLNTTARHYPGKCEVVMLPPADAAPARRSHIA